MANGSTRPKRRGRVEREMREALRTALTDIGYKVRIVRHAAREGRITTQDGRARVQWAAVVEGYGDCLQNQNMMLVFNVAPNRLAGGRRNSQTRAAKDRADREKRHAHIVAAIRESADFIDMRETHAAALEYGITRPIRPGDTGANGAHLVTDVGTFAAYVRLFGDAETKAAVGRALDRTFGKRRDPREANGIRVVDMRVEITLTPGGDWPEYWSDEGRPVTPDLWSGGVLTVNASLPETVVEAAIGRRLDEVVSGALAGSRRIVDMKIDEDYLLGPSVTFMVERDDAPLPEVMGRKTGRYAET